MDGRRDLGRDDRRLGGDCGRGTAAAWRWTAETTADAATATWRGAAGALGMTVDGLPPEPMAQAIRPIARVQFAGQ